MPMSDAEQFARLRDLFHEAVELSPEGRERYLASLRGEDGLPYLVMEYVEGIPIDAFCEKRELSIEQRLRLFRVACEAVEHAHRLMVVHRDLKPANILVTEAGEVKLLDFGIAKLLPGTE